MNAVVKIGSSSVTAAGGEVDVAAVEKLCGEVARFLHGGHRVVVVSSGAIAAGRSVLSGRAPSRREGPAGAAPSHLGAPVDLATLQAVSAVGQSRLMGVYDQAFTAHGLVAGQVLLAPLDFVHRGQYLRARKTLSRLLDLGVVPVVNENDAVADEEIRFGDNDRLAALVAHLVRADLLVLLTDTAGLMTADPRIDRDGTLIEEVVEIDHALEAVAGGPGSAVGSGGMASKLAAAKIAAWSGIRTVIAAAGHPDVVASAAAGDQSVGTTVPARAARLSARKLWIAFAVAPSGTVVVDEGARRALAEGGRSLLSAGVISITGDFDVDDAVEVAGPDGVVFAKGLARLPAARAAQWMGKRSFDLPADLANEVVHRDDLVVVPSSGG
ncbi:MAG: glutamate 5-kinase [Actinomycetota bacterium]|nr:glutamate 5-kinase [Actinomycetota bacterium]